MAKTRKSLIKPRSIAFQHQHGHCFYCNQPMWSDDFRDFVSKYGLTLKQAWYFQYTGDHLKAHSNGGSASRSNHAYPVVEQLTNQDRLHYAICNHTFAFAALSYTCT